MPHTAIRAGLILTTALLLASCAIVQQLVKPPALSVTDMRLGKLGLFEQVLEFDLKLDNPNGFALPLAGMNYTLELGGVEIGKGAQRSPLSVPANGQADWPVSFTVNSLRLVQSAMEKGSIDELAYRIHGQFLLSENSRLPPIPFDKRGTVAR